jgi:ABC-type nitrate/sulfonate/bicarbonate transport system permease component
MKSSAMLAGFGFLGTILVWQLLAALPLGPYSRFISSPQEVFRALVELISWQSFPVHLATTFIVLGAGLLISVPPGVILGILIGRYPKLETLLYFHLYIIASLPGVIITLMAIVLFGVGFWAKLAVVLWGTLLPVITYTLTAYRSTATWLKEEEEAAWTLGASRWKSLWSIVLPNMWQGILIGIKQAMARGFRALISFEVIATMIGLGALARAYSDSFQLAKLYAVVWIVIAITAALVILGDTFENKIDPYRKPDRK